MCSRMALARSTLMDAGSKLMRLVPRAARIQTDLAQTQLPMI